MIKKVQRHGDLIKAHAKRKTTFIRSRCNNAVNMRGLFVCLFALRPMSTAMVIVGRSVHLTTLFPGQA